MTAIAEKVKQNTLFQNFANAFKEVKNDPGAIKWSMKGIYGVIYSIGIVATLGPAAMATASALKTANRIIWLFQSTGEISVWSNYKYVSLWKLVKDSANTISYIPVFPHLIRDFKIYDITLPKPVGIGFDCVDIFLATCSAGASVSKIYECKNGSAAEKCKDKTKFWEQRIVEIKKDDFSEMDKIAEKKSFKVCKIEKEEMKAAFLNYACLEKMKWQDKEQFVPAKLKSGLYQLAFTVSLATMLSFAILSAVTAIPAFGTAVTVALPITAFFKIHGFLYDAFNPAPATVPFKMAAAAAA